MYDFIQITSKDNPLIKLVSSLQNSSKSRRQNGLFVLEGLRICKDAYQNSINFDKLIVTNFALEKYGDDINLFRENTNNCFILPEQLFKKISDTDNPQGIIAIANMPNFDGKINSNGRYVALENIADPSNLGAIARTAEALGVNGIILSSNSCDPYSPKSLRSSMGTLLRLPLYITDDIIHFTKINDLRTFACVVDDSATKINTVSFSNGDVIIIGNEANGLTEQVKKESFECVTIPMNGKAESLNAAAAAAISIWEMMKV